MKRRNRLLVSLILGLSLLIVSPSAEAKRKKRRRHAPIPTHPIYLWAKTLAESKDDAQRKIAAFKISQYTQPIYQVQVIDALLGCMKDDNLHIKVLCTKALGRARKKSKSAQVRSALMAQFKNEPFLRNTIVRTLIALHADEPHVQSLLMQEMKTTKKEAELVVLLSYFENFGSGTDAFVADLAKIFRENADNRVKTAVAKVLGEKASGQQAAIDLLAACTKSTDTPLVLTCLAGLESQGHKRPETWRAIEHTILSNDSDVLEASLDVVDTLNESPNPKIAARLLQLVNDVDDPQIKEKAVLALGVCGTQSADIVELLQKLVEEVTVDENIRIAAALVLGKQAARHPDSPMRVLGDCGAREKSQNLRTACSLGLQELKTRTAGAASSVAAQETAGKKR